MTSTSSLVPSPSLSSPLNLQGHLLSILPSEPSPILWSVDPLCTLFPWLPSFSLDLFSNLDSLVTAFPAGLRLGPPPRGWHQGPSVSSRGALKCEFAGCTGLDHSSLAQTGVDFPPSHPRVECKPPPPPSSLQTLSLPRGLACCRQGLSFSGSRELPACLPLTPLILICPQPAFCF